MNFRTDFIIGHSLLDILHSAFPNNKPPFLSFAYQISFMIRTILLLFIILTCLPGFSQKKESSKKEAIDSTLATIDVLVTDFKDKPSKGEQVMLIGQNTGKTFGGRSDAKGRFTLNGVPGDQYTVVVKSISDTSKHGLFAIPALGPDEYFTAPFTLRVRFELAKSYTLDHVHFDFGKASLRPESYPELEELAGFLRNKETVKIEIAGHTDNVGKDTDNLKLSQQRADAIKAWLLKKGISTARVVAKGYGATQPVADNSNDEGRQRNRRTEVRIVSQ
jgi:OOP family OmpA-OmpF porin